MVRGLVVERALVFREYDVVQRGCWVRTSANRHKWRAAERKWSRMAHADSVWRLVWINVFRRAATVAGWAGTTLDRDGRIPRSAFLAFLIKSCGEEMSASN
jgi:hypothetical protein